MIRICFLLYSIFHVMFQTSAININNILLIIYFISKHSYFVILQEIHKLKKTANVTKN